MFFEICHTLDDRELVTVTNISLEKKIEAFIKLFNTARLRALVISTSTEVENLIVLFS